MVIRVTANYGVDRDGVDIANHSITSTFDSVQEFIDEMGDEASTDTPNLLSVFGDRSNLSGSDLGYTFEGTDSMVPYPQLFASLRRHRGENFVDGNTRLVAEQGSNEQSVFRYTTVRDATTRPSVRNGTRNRGVLDFANDSATITEIKKWIVNPINHNEIEETLSQAGSRVYIRGVELKTVDEIVAHYSKLGCILFSLELYYGRSKLLQLFQRVLRLPYTADPTRLASKMYNGFRVTRHIHESLCFMETTNNLVQKVLGVLDRKCGLIDGVKRGVGHAITELELACISNFLCIEFYMYRADVYRDVMKVYNLESPSTVEVPNEHVVTHDELVKKRTNQPMIVYQCKAPGGSGTFDSRKHRYFETVIFVVTDLWEENMHAEAVFNAPMVHQFVRENHRRLNPEVRYINGDSVNGMDYVESINSQSSDLVSPAQYLEPVKRNLEETLLVKPPTTTYIRTGKEMEEFIDRIRKCTAQFFQLVDRELDTMAGNDETSIKDAFYQLVESIPRSVVICPEFFKVDAETKSVCSLQPYSYEGIRSMLDLAAVFVYMTHLESDQSEALPHLKFGKAESSSHASILRKIMTKRAMNQIESTRDYLVPDMKEGVMRLPGIKSFSFYIDTSAVVGGIVGSSYIGIYFSVRDPPKSRLAKKVVEDVFGELPQSPLALEASMNVLAKLEKRLENATEEEVPEIEQYIKLVRSREGIEHVYKSSNLIFDTFLLQKGTHHEKSRTGAYYLLKFEEIQPKQLEPAQAHSPQLTEPVVPISVDGSSFNLADHSTLLEVDMSKFYSSISQGAYTDVWKDDLFRHPPQVGGLKNPSYQEVTRLRPIVSHFADFGAALITGASMNWHLLETMCPSYFSKVSSWWCNRYRKATHVSSSAIISCCMEVCDILGIDGRKDRIDKFAEIQVEGMGITHASFDFSRSERDAFFKMFLASSSIDGLAEHFGPIIGTALSERYIVPRRQKSAFQIKDHAGLKTKPISHISKYRDGMYVANGKKMNGLFNRMADANIRLFNACDGDQEAIREIKDHNNTFVGKLKNVVPGGMYTSHVSDLLATSSPNERELDGSKRRKTGKIEAEVNGIKVSHGANTAYFVAPLTGTDRSIVMNLSCKIQVTRNSIHPFRRYIMETARLVMDKLSSVSSPFRVATDSILIDPDHRDVVRNLLVRWTSASDETPFSYPCPGYMPSFTMKEIDMTRMPMNDVSMVPVCDRLPFKYEAVRKATWTHHEHVPMQLTEMQQEELDKVFVEFTEYKDSEMFRKFYLSEKRPFPELDNDHTDPHLLFKTLVKHYEKEEKVAEFFNRFSKWSASFIYDLGGAVLIGDPGAGKTERCKQICRHSHKNGDKPVVTGAMHSVVQLYGECSLPGGEFVDRMTIHSFCGCQLGATKHARNPDGVLNFHFGRQKCMPRTYQTIICDEVETFDQCFEEYLKRCKERWGMNVFLVGDPLQSSPMFGRGFDMDGSVARYLSNGNRYHFDLQFRNTDDGYSQKLCETAKGKVSQYLHRDMTYYEDRDGGSNATMDMLIDECVRDIIHRRPTRVFAVPNYNLNVCIVTEVLRRCSMEDDSFLQGTEVLTHIGTFCPGAASGDLDIVVQETMAKKKEHDKMYYNACDNTPIPNNTRIGGHVFTHGKNGAKAMKRLVGMPLVMRHGMEFRALSQFKSKLTKPFKRSMQEYTSSFHKTNVYTFSNSYNVSVRWDKDGGASTETGGIRVYQFVCPGGKDVFATHIEVCVYFTYAFAIQREFILGTTLDKLAVIQPYYRDNYGSYVTQHYTPLKVTLSEQEKVLGTRSIHTRLARFMRVAATRVRKKNSTFVLDLDVGDKFFWTNCTWNHTNFLVSQCKTSHYTEWHRKCVSWRAAIRFSKTKLVRVSGRVPSVRYMGTKFPAENLIPPPKEMRSIFKGEDDWGIEEFSMENAVDPEWIRKCSFPLYLDRDE